jgi:hypothetical protein
MARIVRLTEKDLTRLVKRVVKEQSDDEERFTLGDIRAGAVGTKGSWIVENGSLKLVDCEFDDGYKVTVDVQND